MAIKKSGGYTPTEKLLAELCNGTFLKLWSYPNPFKEDRQELCDLIAIFENQVFIFFDREGRQFDSTDEDLHTSWRRWKRKVIDNQVRTAHGAEKYIRSRRRIYLDPKLETPLPIALDYDNLVVHRLIVAHGAKDACKRHSKDNLYGSLAISYGKVDIASQFPFFVALDKNDPVHVLDSHNLPIILSELDTVFDFSTYLVAKMEAIKSFKALVYCGEEDLLANYYSNFDASRNRHFIGTSRHDIDFVMIEEGAWAGFSRSTIYANRKAADHVSYLWDELIQTTSENALSEELLGDSTPLSGRSAILEMAKEPRFYRRALSEHMIRAIRNFPETPAPIVRNVSFMPSFTERKGYVFLQLKVDRVTDYETEYRPRRQAMLEIACAAAKNKFPGLTTIVGIAIDAPKYAKSNSEDLLLLDCADWPIDVKEHYERANVGLDFFQTDSLKTHTRTVQNFPSTSISKSIRRGKIGPNSRCPCGSGKKYKKCCWRP